MKKIILTILTISLIGLGANAQNVHIPDAKFKAYLLASSNINTNADTAIQVSEAIAFTGELKIPSKSINDLTGIEAFTAITKLNCQTNNLTEMDLTNNKDLTYISCHSNSLTSLDLTQNTKLTTLYANHNLITTLDLSKNINLVTFYCNSNKLTALDVTKNLALVIFACQDNFISKLDVTKNTALGTFYCQDNSIDKLDLSQNVKLGSFTCQNNSIYQLNIANGNNSKVTKFDATSNYNLTCIQVDNVALSNDKWPKIDVAANYSTNCGYVDIEEQKQTKLTIYPSPVTSTLTIESDEFKIYSISIIDITGKLVKTTYSMDRIINVSLLNKGIYFLQVNTDNGFIIKKFIKE